MHPTKATSVWVLDRLASLRRFPPPSLQRRLSLAGTLWDGFRAIPSRGQITSVWSNPAPGEAKSAPNPKEFGPGDQRDKRDNGVQANECSQFIQ
jgi:hypothetical protein